MVVSLACLGMLLVPALGHSTARTYPGAAPCNTTLQACIDGSAAADTINIVPGSYNQGEISVTKSLTISRSGTSGVVTLQSSGTHRVINTTQNIAGGVTLANLTITGGACAGAQLGGGIFADTGTPLHLVGVTVSGNACAGNSGGGIYVAADLTMTDVTLTLNSAAGGAGGGLRASGNVVIDGGSITQNTSLNHGGGMRVTGTLTMTNVDVIANTVTGVGENGGGIRADGGLTLTGGTIKDNVSSSSGGGIYAASATISGATFQNDTAFLDGGAIRASGVLDVTDTLFVQNSANRGGAIYSANTGVSTRLTGTTNATATQFSGNQAGNGGGAVDAVGDVLLTGFTSFVDNETSAYGAAILANNVDYADLPAGNSSTFSGNFGSDHGAAIHAAGTVTLLNAQFDGNGDPDGFGDGGAIWAGGDVLLTGGHSKNNYAINGGAVYSNGSIVFDHHDTTDHDVEGQGGCAWAAGDVEYISASAANCTASRGGAIYANGTVKLTANSVGTFTQNDALVDDGGVAYAANVQISGSPRIEGNTAQRNGGVALATGSLSVVDSVLAGNSAQASGGALFTGSVAAITGSQFSANTAGDKGGAAQANDDLYVSKSIFSDNTAVNEGGALFLSRGVFVRASEFVANSSQVSGAIGTSTSASLHQMQIVDSLFVDDRETTFNEIGGADLFLVDSAAQLVNDTFVQRGALAARSIAADGSAIDAFNSIFSGYGSAFADFANHGALITEDYNDFFNAPPGALATSLGHSLSVDPKFTSIAGGNLRLTSASTLVDAGTNNVSPDDESVDLDGRPRFVDIPGKPNSGTGIGAIDIGAYEFGDEIFANGFQFGF